MALTSALAFGLLPLLLQGAPDGAVDVRMEYVRYPEAGEVEGIGIDPVLDPVDPTVSTDKRYGTGGDFSFRRAGGRWRRTSARSEPPGPFVLKTCPQAGTVSPERLVRWLAMTGSRSLGNLMPLAGPCHTQPL